MTASTWPDAWALTGAISPRVLVRAAATDTAGAVLNSYPLVHPITGHRPRTPWAVHLADLDGRFRLLCFDLDAKVSASAVRRDQGLLTDLLTEVGLPHLVCRSGPTGGVHVWLGLAESVDAELVGVLARLANAWLPTLDVSALLNPATGCVRPPGAPHRLGGTSTPVGGSVTVLLHPTSTQHDVARLVEALATRVTTTERPAEPRPTARPIARDSHGSPYLPGTRRELPTSSRRALTTPFSQTTDASAVLWSVLCGAAAAHWQLDDVRPLLAEPGLEHARTIARGAARVPRPTSGPSAPAAVLARQWTRAVRAMANAPSGRAGDDPTFDDRAELVAAVVRRVQARADAGPSRWHGRLGLAHRKVLDTVCLFALQAVRVDVEADVRRLALHAGIDRETARRSLIALARDGWIERTRPASGPRAATWTTDPTRAIERAARAVLSQADPRPDGAGAAQRRVLLDEITDRLATAGHDAFAPRGGLGPQAGALYARLHRPRTTTELARLSGCTPDELTTRAETLAAAGLILAAGRGWVRAEPSGLDALADDLGTAGRAERRAAAYAVERQTWQWWLDELVRLAQARRPLGRWRSSASRRRPTHPRHPNGRADFAEARRRCAAGEGPTSACTHRHVHDVRATAVTLRTVTLLHSPPPMDRHLHRSDTSPAAPALAHVHAQRTSQKWPPTAPRLA